MLTSQLLHEKNILLKKLNEVQDEKNKIVSESPESREGEMWQLNQKILELQEEIKAIDRKLT